MTLRWSNLAWLLIISFISCNSSKATETTQVTRAPIDSRYILTQTASIENKDTSSLFKNAKRWAIDNFPSGKEGLLYQNSEEGKIRGSGNLFVPYDEGKRYLPVRFRFTIFINKRAKLLSIGFSNLEYWGKPNTTENNDESKDWYSSIKGQRPIYYKDTVTKLQALISSFFMTLHLQIKS